MHTQPDTSTHRDGALRGEGPAAGAPRRKDERGDRRGEHLGHHGVLALAAAGQGHVGPGHRVGLRVVHGRGERLVRLGARDPGARAHGALGEGGAGGKLDDEAGLVEGGGRHRLVLLVGVGQDHRVAEGGAAAGAVANGESADAGGAHDGHGVAVGTAGQGDTLGGAAGRAGLCFLFLKGGKLGMGLILGFVRTRSQVSRYRWVRIHALDGHSPRKAPCRFVWWQRRRIS